MKFQSAKLNCLINLDSVDNNHDYELVAKYCDCIQITKDKYICLDGETHNFFASEIILPHRNTTCKCSPLTL